MQRVIKYFFCAIILSAWGVSSECMRGSAGADAALLAGFKAISLEKSCCVCSENVEHGCEKFILSCGHWVHKRCTGNLRATAGQKVFCSACGKELAQWLLDLQLIPTWLGRDEVVSCAGLSCITYGVSVMAEKKRDSLSQECLIAQEILDAIVELLVQHQTIFFISGSYEVRQAALAWLKAIGKRYDKAADDYYKKILPIVRLFKCALAHYKPEDAGGEFCSNPEFWLSLPPAMAPAYVAAAEGLGRFQAPFNEYGCFTVSAAYLGRRKKVLFAAWKLFQPLKEVLDQAFEEGIAKRDLAGVIAGLTTLHNLVSYLPEEHESLWELALPRLRSLKSMVVNPADDKIAEVYELYWGVLAAFADNGKMVPCVFDFMRENPEVVKPLRELPAKAPLKNSIFWCLALIQTRVPELEGAIKEFLAEQRVEIVQNCNE